MRRRITARTWSLHLLLLLVGTIRCRSLVSILQTPLQVSVRLLHLRVGCTMGHVHRLVTLMGQFGFFLLRRLPGLQRSLRVRAGGLAFGGVNEIWVDNRVDFSQNTNLIVAAITIILGTGEFTLKFGDFALGGIGTATFGAILLHALLRRAP